MGTTTKSNKQFNAALFAEALRQKNFTNLLTDGAPKAMPGKSSKQTDKGAPVVRIQDLSKEAGDEVEVDIFHQLAGKPTMGDRKLEGRGEVLTSAQMSLKINQGRHMVDTGGKMAQQRTKHNLREIGRNLLSGNSYWGRLSDQTTLTHLAGARGTRLATDHILPLADDPEFGEIIVNPILPPTYDRHFFGGDATSVNTLDAADLFTLDTVENMRLTIDEMDSMRMQPIKLANDPMVDADPLYVLYVSPRMMTNFKQTTSGKQLNQLLADAHKRAAGWNHPLFQGECFMWEGILIKKMTDYVEFAAGSTVDVSQNNNAATVTQATTGVRMHRGILLGAQALAHAFGNVGTQNGEDAGYVGMTEEETDHGNGREIAIRWMDGKKKIRFADKNGRVNDHGVMVLDCAVE